MKNIIENNNDCKHESYYNFSTPSMRMCFWCMECGCPLAITEKNTGVFNLNDIKSPDNGDIVLTFEILDNIQNIQEGKIKVINSG